MSSHHVVREKQEPALLVLDPDGFEDELLGQLLEWSPTVIATADSVEQLNSKGIKVDWLIIEEAYDNSQPNVNRLVCEPGNQLKTAMDWLIGNQYPAVNIITSSFKQETFSRYQSEIDMVIFCQYKKIYPVVSGFNKWKPAGENIELFSETNNLEAEGLEPVEKYIYKTIANGFIKLSFLNKFIFISEYL